MDSFNDIFLQVLALCKNDSTLAEATYNLFFSDLSPVDFDMVTGKVTLSSPSGFKQQLVQQKYASMIAEKFKQILGFDVNIEIISKSDADEAEITEEPSGDSSDKFTFDNFVVGSGNQFAYAACQRVAASPGTVYNPLFIYGRSGLGKTHLLLAIQNEILRTNPNASIRYTTSENFSNDMVAYLAQKNMEEFHNKYRKIDVLLIDDVQFLQNKMGFQEEFFHTFNALTQVNHQIIITSDRPPKEIDTLTDRLRSRFESGLLADIQPPDIETRTAIVKKKAQQYGLNITTPVAEFIANKLKSNIRQLEGAVKKLSARASLTGKNGEVTLDMAEAAIRDVQTDNMPPAVRTEKIIDYISKYYGVTVEDILSNKRNATVALARQVCAYVLTDITGQTLDRIGQSLGGKNHSTIHYSIGLVKQKMQDDPEFKNNVFEIINNIQE
ncbi:MAG: chromosomal replication initiator protein DnaA [Clostridia bacterium]|nr:chromosomal replication initiator protein DnaA [Clostridia bacterium]